MGRGPRCSLLLQRGGLFYLPGWDPHEGGTGSWVWAADMPSGCSRVSLDRHGREGSCTELSIMGDNHPSSQDPPQSQGLARTLLFMRKRPRRWVAGGLVPGGGFGVQSRPQWVHYSKISVRPFIQHRHGLSAFSKLRSRGPRGEYQRHGSTLSDPHVRTCIITISARD